jgi:hypothetical protein
MLFCVWSLLWAHWYVTLVVLVVGVGLCVHYVCVGSVGGDGAEWT